MKYQHAKGSLNVIYVPDSPEPKLLCHAGQDAQTNKAMTDSVTATIYKWFTHLFIFIYDKVCYEKFTF